MNEQLYPIALRLAQRCLHRIGRKSVDGKEAHDFAIDAVLRGVVIKRAICFDVIDAYRREIGRRGHRRLVGIPRHLEAADEHATLELPKDLTPVQRETALLLAAGYSAADIARLRGVTETAVCAIKRRISERMHAWNS